MAYKSVVQVGAAATSGSVVATNFNFNHTCEDVPDRVVIVAVGARDGTVGGDTLVTSVTYGGTLMTSVAADSVGGGGAAAVGCAMFIINNPTPGVNNVVVQMAGGTPAEAIATAFTCWGIDRTTPQDAAGQTNTGNTTGSEIDTVVSIERASIVSAVALNAGGGVTVSRPTPFPGANPGSTPTIISDVQGTNLEVHCLLGTSDIIPNLTTICTLTWTSQKFVHVVGSLRPIRRRSHSS